MTEKATLRPMSKYGFICWQDGPTHHSHRVSRAVKDRYDRLQREHDAVGELIKQWSRGSSPWMLQVAGKLKEARGE